MVPIHLSSDGSKLLFGPGESRKAVRHPQLRGQTPTRGWIERKAVASRARYCRYASRPMMDLRAREWTVALLCQFHHDLFCGLIEVCDTETANLPSPGQFGFRGRRSPLPARLQHG